MAFRVRVREHERGLRFVNGNFAGIVGPGVHRLWRNLLPLRSERIDVCSVHDVELSREDLSAIVARNGLGDHLTVLRLGETDRAIVWLDGRVHEVLGPGLRAFWRESGRLEVQWFSTTTPRLEHAMLNAVLAHPSAAIHLQTFSVDPEERAELIVSGRVAEQLGPGRHVFWRGIGPASMRRIDLRESVLDVSGQEILTADKVTLRVNLHVAYRVVDAAKALSSVSDAGQALYRSAQLALRDAVGARTLDKLLADKEAVGSEVRTVLLPRAEALGLELGAVGLRDVILPGEMRSIFNQVIEAEKRAQAELIRRREETAAARSQANTARLLAEHPILARQKELELLRDVLAGTKASFVLGPGDLSDQIRGLVSGLETL
ncbi:MAG: slipin family protein [Phycisphaerales bacterium JB040]